MSEEGGFGSTFAARFSGLLLIIIGVIAMFYTFASTQVLGAFTVFFGFLSFIPLALGLVLITAKIE